MPSPTLEGSCVERSTSRRSTALHALYQGAKVLVDPGISCSSRREPALPSTANHHMGNATMPGSRAPLGLARDVKSDQTTGTCGVAAPAGRAVVKSAPANG
jgi:hypothetical protein